MAKISKPRYSDYYHRRLRKPGNIHIWAVATLNFCHYFLKNYLITKQLSANHGSSTPETDSNTSAQGSVWQYIDVRPVFILDFVYRKCWHFLFLNTAFTVKWCNFLNLPACLSWSIICLYPLNHCVHITDNYVSKNSLCKYSVKVPIVNPAMSPLYRYQGVWLIIVILDFLHFLQPALPQGIF